MSEIAGPPGHRRWGMRPRADGARAGVGRGLRPADDWHGCSIDVVRLLQRGSRLTDYDPPLDWAKAYKHAMRAPFQSTEDALNKWLDFKTSKRQEARDYADRGRDSFSAKHDCKVASPYIKCALVSLGEASHATMDYHSPLHFYFQLYPKPGSVCHPWGEGVAQVRPQAQGIASALASEFGQDVSYVLKE